MAVERVGLSFVIGAALSSAFKTNFKTVNTSISSIQSSIKELSKERLDINKQIKLNPEKAEEFQTRLSEIDKELTRLEARKEIEIKFESNLKDFKGNLSEIGKITAGIAAGAGVASAVGAKFVQFGNEYTRTMNSVAAQTGATAKEIAEFGKIAQEIYISGKGESMQGIANALTSIKQTAGLAGDELRAATEASIVLGDTFGFEVNETTRAASALMKNFGINAKEAYGLIAVGAQNGANKNGDLLDTLNEYSVHFKALGMDSSQFMSVLINGAESGAFSIDKIGDAVKEFNIRSKDGSKTSIEAYRLLGLNADVMSAKFAAGGETAQAAFNQVVNAIDSIQDPVKKNAVGVALFGTMFEDLEAGVLKNFTNINGSAINAQKTLEELNRVKYNDLGYAITQVTRSFETALIPSAERAGQAVYENMPQIKSAISQITPQVAALGQTFANALPGIITWVGSAAQKAAGFARVVIDNWGAISPVLYTVAGAYTAVKVGTTLLSGATLFLTGVTKTATIVTQAVTVAQWALNAALTANPIGLVVAGVAALIGAGIALYKNWDTISKFFISTWEGIKGAVAGGFEYISAILPKVLEKILAPFEAVKNGISKVKSFLFGEDEEDKLEFKQVTEHKSVKVLTSQASVPFAKAYEPVTAPISEPVTRTYEPATKAYEPATKAYEPVNSANINVNVPVQDTPNVAGYYEKGGLVQQHSINNNNMNAPLTYAPNITIQGNANKEDILEAEKMSQREFEKMYKQQRYNDARLSYGGY